ncbi:MAG TPA: GNAT family N-acetyltransferase [Thermoplasmata archaeon]|nr:GNAT family N-acetyltransferase [Thermoplasmata archaeon]
MARRSSPLRVRLTRLRFPIHGPRVDLVLPSSRHVPALVRLMEEPSVARGSLHIPYPYSVRDALAWVRATARDRRRGEALGLAIVRRANGELLGGALLHQFHEGSRRAEVGYWLGRKHRGQGYATEATRLLMSVGFDRLGLHRIEARIFPRNAASLRVVRRCGFRYEGRLRDEVQKDGRWRTTLLFARLASDAPPRHTARRK